MFETNDLEIVLATKVPIVVVETPDERRILDILARHCIKQNLACHVWTHTRGLRRLSFADAPDESDIRDDPSAVLKYIATKAGPALYALCDLHAHLNRSGEHAPKLIRYLKDIALDFDQLKNTVILISHEFQTPAELGRMTASLKVALPSEAEMMAIIREVAQEWVKRNPKQRVKTDEETIKRLIANLRGVSHADARALVRHAIFRDGALTESDIPIVNKLKFQLLSSEGLLRFEHDTASFNTVAGLATMKRWLAERKAAFVSTNTADRPKGILLLGVQGSGKSLAARAVAGEWGLPLLRLDFGTLYNKYFGETERNLRNSLEQAEIMAPCVLWIDELEKGIATDDQDHATSKRVLGTLLTWMAERKSQVFIVATANDVSKLPPELIRKGRMDEIFFVDLPALDERVGILQVHFEKRGIETQGFDLQELAAISDGFTGAELEHAVVAARYRASAAHTTVTQAHLVQALTETYPISVTMAEKIESLRNWAKDRTVTA